MLVTCLDVAWVTNIILHIQRRLLNYDSTNRNIKYTAKLTGNFSGGGMWLRTAQNS